MVVKMEANEVGEKVVEVETEPQITEGKGGEKMVTKNRYNIYYFDNRKKKWILWHRFLMTPYQARDEKKRNPNIKIVKAKTRKRR